MVTGGEGSYQAKEGGLLGLVVAIVLGSCGAPATSEWPKGWLPILKLRCGRNSAGRRTQGCFGQPFGNSKMEIRASSRLWPGWRPADLNWRYCQSVEGAL